MARFLVDLRGLDERQRRYASALLHEANSDLTVLDIQDDSITIELSDAQQVANILLNGTDIRRNLAVMMDAACQRRSDLFIPNAYYAWRTRIFRCSGM